MTDKQSFRLVNDRVRANALRAVADAPADYVVSIGPRKRSSDQNAMFHAICADLAASPLTFAGKRRSMLTWKSLLVSGHAVATGEDGEVIPGIESEFVAIRESSANMSVRRAASLITYALAFCDMHGVELTATIAAGYGDRADAA
jgi:hypothetical protein